MALQDGFNQGGAFLPMPQNGRGHLPHLVGSLAGRPVARNEVYLWFYTDTNANLYQCLQNPNGSYFWQQISAAGSGGGSITSISGVEGITVTSPSGAVPVIDGTDLEALCLFLSGD